MENPRSLGFTTTEPDGMYGSRRVKFSTEDEFRGQKTGRRLKRSRPVRKEYLRAR